VTKRETITNPKSEEWIRSWNLKCISLTLTKYGVWLSRSRNQSYMVQVVLQKD